MVSDSKAATHRQDRLKQIRSFCQAARLGSISRAADHVHSSQPVVSRQVRALEEELGVTLFERSGPRIALTLAGERLYHLALPIVEKIDRLPETFREVRHGAFSRDLNIAAGQSIAASVLPPYLKRFFEHYPGIRVNLKTGDGRQRIQWLRSYDVDVAFGPVDVPSADLVFQPLFESTHFLITPQDHPLAGRVRVALGDAVAYPAVAHPSESHADPTADLIARQFGLVGEAVVEVADWQMIKLCVEAGLGVSVVPDLCLSERDRVWKIPVSEYFPTRTYGLIVRRDNILSLAAQRFLEIVKAGVR